MMKSDKKKSAKYASLCRELLTLHNVEDPSPQDIDTFVEEPTISTFFEHTTNHFISLWNSWSNSKDRKNDLKNGVDPDEPAGQKEIKALDKKDRRLQSREFVPYSLLYGNGDEESNGMIPGSPEKQAAEKDEQQIPPLNDPDITGRQGEKSLQKKKETEKKGLETKRESNAKGDIEADRDAKGEIEAVTEPKTEVKAATETKSEPKADIETKSDIETAADTKADTTIKREQEMDNSSAATGPDERAPVPFDINANRPDISNKSPSVYFKLPNATCGKDYNAGFETGSDMHTGRAAQGLENHIDIITVKGLENTGLTYNRDENSVWGIPVKSGEIKLEIIFTLPHTREKHGTECIFIINPDPRSLWKDKPSDKNALFWKKDEDKQELMTDNGWTLVGASKRGRSHAHEGKCRDDHFFISADSSTKWNILAVADGAGSASMSREGARIAVMESSRVLSEKLDEFDSEIIDILADNAGEDRGTGAKGADGGAGVKGSELGVGADTVGETGARKLKDMLYNVFSLAVYAPVKAIHDTIKQHENLKFRDFNTTLVLTAHKEIQGRHFTAAYWMGDGGAVVYREGESVTLLGEVDSGEFAGQTRFLDNSAINKDDIYKRIRFDYQDSITALIAMTDGITDPFFETDHNLNQLEYWDNLWKGTLKKRFSDTPNETAQNMLDWLDFWSQGNHDDRTVALLFKKEGK